MEPQGYVVSSRKYRPSTFDTVVGQDHITQTLKNAIRSQHLAQAFLFCGPRGVGKTTCARILAKTINCKNLTSDCEPCNSCESCTAFNVSHSFNIYELDAASNNSVEDIRSLVEQVRYPPQGASYKIYIIDEVHMLSTAAFNAFLKTLEEPPSYAIFILATTERHKILPTILSRCQVFNFNRIRIEDSVLRLKEICEKEGVTADDDALFTISQKADGALRDALTIFDQMVSSAGNHLTYKHLAEHLHILDRDYFFNVTNMVLESDGTGLMILLDEVVKQGFDLNQFLLGLSEHFRDLLVSRSPDTLKLLEVPEKVGLALQGQTRKLSTGQILNFLNMLNQADVQFRNARNPRLHVELCLLRMAHLPHVIDLRKQAMTVPAAQQTSVGKPIPFKSGPELKKIPGASMNWKKKMEEKQEVTEEQQETQEMATITIDVLPENKIPEIIQLFRQDLAARDKKMLLAIFDQLTFRKSGDREIQITIPGPAAMMFEEERTGLSTIIRERTGVPVKIVVETLQTQQREAYFTADEKLRKMLDSNPVLLDFGKDMDLRLE